VAPTLLALLIVGGAFGAWFRFRFRAAGPSAPAASAPATTQTLALSNATPPSADPAAPPGPGSGEPASAASTSSIPSPANPPLGEPLALPPPPSQLERSADAVPKPSVARAPWAVKRSATAAKSKPAAAHRAGKTSDSSTRRHASSPPETEDEAPTVEVNGRRIPMTLEPTQ
jgi:hypothetical protein